jgi:hypothetical protein
VNLLSVVELSEFSNIIGSCSFVGTIHQSAYRLVKT